MLRREQQRRLAAAEPISRRASPTASTRCRTARCCSSPTSSSTRCRFASWCAAATVGPSGSSRSTAANRTERLVFVEGPESPALALLVPPGLRDAPPGTVVEICPAAAALAASLGERLARRPGAGPVRRLRLFPEPARPDSGRGAPSPSGVDPRRTRARPISAPMSISRLSPRRRAPPAPRRTARCRSGDSSLALGAEARLAALSRRAAPAQRAALESGLARLIDPAQMGNLFKVLALTSPGLPPPAGFARHPADDDRATMTPPC